MAYVKYHDPWHDAASATGGGDTSTPLQAAALDHIEAGIYATALVADAAASAGIPAGVIAAYGGSSAPSGWVLCDGGVAATATYPALFTAIGYQYGGAGANFNLPDLQGRVPVGKGTHTEVDTLGENEGASVSNRSPSHSHTPSNGGSFLTHTSGTLSYRTQGGAFTNVDVARTSGNGALTDKPAYLVINYIIKT